MAQSFKLKINTLLNKLGDRDTFSLAAAELESVSRNLDAISLPTFLSCILSVDSSDKCGVRKQCVKLVSVLAVTYPNSLPHFLHKILSSLLRRLRDPDSAVRSACVDAVSALSTNLTKCNFSSSFLKPLSDALFTEQEPNAQIGAALCLAAAIDGSPDPDAVRLGRMLTKLEKLVKSDACKAKAAVMVVIGSVIGSGGASNLSQGMMKGLVGCLIGFLSSEDWAARKGAAEALGRLAIAERDSLAEFKTSCMKVFEARRFDKVKAAREVMSQMLEAWKQVPDFSEEASPPPLSQASSKEDASDGRYPPGSKISSNVDVAVPQTRKKPTFTTRSTPPESSFATTARKRSPLKATIQKVNGKKPLDWRLEIAVPHAANVTGACEDSLKERSENVSRRRNNENVKSAKSDIKRVLFSNKNSDDKMHKFGGSKSGSRVAPCHEETTESTVVVSNASENLNANHKDSEDLSLIRSQLVQIEKQQSRLLDLLQRFVCSSQTGMHSLETRVHGLELALDEISYDLAVSTGRMSSSSRTTCCLLPAAGFLSSKFWRKTEGRYATSWFSTSSGTPSVAATRCRADRNWNAEAFKLENHRLRLQGGGGFIMNPLAEIHGDSRRVSEIAHQ
ncbi:PREDICTED: microtubule-associated protein TORTIFOLIA1 [Theobroma cacao]|uniref:Microtubule-associated protein TORTIFOLIA1 n=1 Tax=Theobroma cacao TaxID=3641 RepID=A0AB32W5P9_THECC|nr:PREDICTED: microtubule-associated protein TORTIFOLIA1 [Theobroma cacao]XP_017973258.1 PREDICTED: microtubule-associated protein TORTIFOLIA1 [Theobroma cacao]